jgi:23S rRNA pseudouridine2605 synthase
LIRAGRVSLEGKVRRDPESPVRGDQSQIAVDGKVITAREKLYFMLNKPRGVITTASDEKARDTVYSLLGRESEPVATSSDENPWVAPVGRLDKASEGLLLLTNDSEWAAQITAPESHLNKTYHVQLGRLADAAFLERLTGGVNVRDGEMLRVKQAKFLRLGEKNCWLEIVLDEGKNRHIRRMMEALGVEVLRLVRVAIGPLQLGDLGKGQYRALTIEEKQMLDRAFRKRQREVSFPSAGQDKRSKRRALP